MKNQYARYFVYNLGVIDELHIFISDILIKNLTNLKDIKTAAKEILETIESIQ